MTLRHRLAEQWQKRTAREQILALAVLGLLILLFLFAGANHALAILGRMDRDIERLSTDIINYQYQIARRDSIDARFAQVATQHSSAWTESQIRDRLRLEIYRLANRIPPGLDADGIPLSTNGEGGALVSIPKLGQGRLEEGGDGYREYQISVQIPPAPVEDLLAYLERLQSSPQSLRLDRVDLRRDPAQSMLRASLDITRIVVDTPFFTSTAPEHTPLPQPGENLLTPDDWQRSGCDIHGSADGTLIVAALEANGRAILHRRLPSGVTYDLRLTISTEGTARIVVASEHADFSGEAMGPIETGGAWMVLRTRFTVPDHPLGQVDVQVPAITFEDDDSRLSLRQMTLVEVSGL